MSHINWLWACSWRCISACKCPCVTKLRNIVANSLFSNSVKLQGSNFSSCRDTSPQKSIQWHCPTGRFYTILWFCDVTEICGAVQNVRGLVRMLIEVQWVDWNRDEWSRTSYWPAWNPQKPEILISEKCVFVAKIALGHVLHLGGKGKTPQYEPKHCENACKPWNDTSGTKKFLFCAIVSIFWCILCKSLL